jgi:hypothetical protein
MMNMIALDPLSSRTYQHFSGTTSEGVTYRTWAGGHVGDAFGADTETTLIGDAVEVPDLIVLGAFNGREVHLVRPDQVLEFFESHPTAVFSFHNAAYDAAVLARAGVPDIFDRIESGQVRCSMILDQLVAIASGERGIPRNLAEVAADRCGMLLDKNDVHRLRFSELQSIPWILADRAFWEYLCRDCIATYRAYAALAKAGRTVMNGHVGEIDRQAVEKYGILTERLQLKARCVPSRHRSQSSPSSRRPDGASSSTKLGSDSFSDRRDRTTRRTPRLQTLCAWIQGRQTSTRGSNQKQ